MELGVRHVGSSARQSQRQLQKVLALFFFLLLKFFLFFPILFKHVLISGSYNIVIVF